MGGTDTEPLEKSKVPRPTLFYSSGDLFDTYPFGSIAEVREHVHHGLTDSDEEC